MKWVNLGRGSYIINVEIYRIRFNPGRGRWQWIADESHGTTRTFREAKAFAEAALREQLGAK